MKRKIVLTGAQSEISKQFKQMIEPLWLTSTEDNIIKEHSSKEDPNEYVDGDIFLMCQGYLVPKSISEQTSVEKEASSFYNYESVRKAVDLIVDKNDHARICVIGSHSAYKGSFDGSYAENKRKLHEYIETKKLRTPTQQLVCIAPTIIEDTRMTLDRKDRDNLQNRRNNHPMKRFLYANEVARMAYTLLFEQPYINCTIIRMHGGDV